MQRNYAHRGITMIEMLVYIGISSIIMLVMFSFMIHLVSARTENSKQRGAQQVSRHILEKITYKLRNAYSVDIYPDQTGMDIYTYEYSDPENPTTIVSTFRLNGDQLLYGETPVSPPQNSQLQPLIGGNVKMESVRFERISSSVSVSFTLTDRGHEVRTQSTLSLHQ